ncbi:SprT-like domain-containing protein [Mangrovimonas sp. AS39]|uniref:SprT-like domain-containing protein n=1 Tax=Mangrovimonas futianensis TaxID=2895523 RepID=UPI001E3EA2EF|nr:SprT-like domain-containing protein [Mangrovimonas futianensis]MCF1192552.1 SprT-like domain-containing protein [Mangrovimonas futianensis]MCF1196118.1 SprT-like domain-containing protein [Mangrovimonas futianensis]MCF1422503.1 SprT-like domain-containing protein [Mangrovimonas futianensis]
MQQKLNEFIPNAAVAQVQELLDHDHLVVKVKRERKTRHGDYRRLINGQHQITINGNLNPYRFLITLIHEIAHFEAFSLFGRNIKPHGKEWKYTFQRLMLPFINPNIFPDELLPLLAKHFRNPKASSDTDTQLALALKQYDPPNGKHFVFEVPTGSIFRLYNGRVFKKGSQRTKRIECIEIATGKVYLFNPNAEIELVKNK